MAELIDYCTTHEGDFVTACETYYPAECLYVRAVVVRLDEVDVEGLAKAWRYGVHCAESPQRDQAWTVVAEQIGKLLEILEAENDL